MFLSSSSIINSFLFFLPLFANFPSNREMHIRVERKRDRDSGEYFEMVDGLMFKDGFLHKTVSLKSIHTQSIQPTFDELEKFKKPGDDMNGESSLSTLFSNRSEERRVGKECLL